MFNLELKDAFKGPSIVVKGLLFDSKFEIIFEKLVIELISLGKIYKLNEIEIKK